LKITIFSQIDRLHATLLGIFAGNGDETGSNRIFEETVYDAIKEYIQSHRSRSINLIIDEIRPGTWRNRNLDNKQVSYCSNGTVFATGPTSNDNKKFCDLGIGLAEYLKDRLDYIFGYNFKRKFPNLSITLGYFNGNDFVIVRKFTISSIT
jgi:hypothetical protein